MIIEQSPDEIAAKLALMSDELGHSVLDIRERAIASLNFKLSNDLLTFKDVGSHSGVLRALLDWFGHEDSVPGDERALAMLRRIIEEEPTAAARLQNLGAEAALLFRRRVARVAPAWQENADALESLLSMAAFALVQLSCEPLAPEPQLSSSSLSFGAQLFCHFGLRCLPPPLLWSQPSSSFASSCSV